MRCNSFNCTRVFVCLCKRIRAFLRANLSYLIWFFTYFTRVSSEVALALVTTALVKKRHKRQQLSIVTASLMTTTSYEGTKLKYELQAVWPRRTIPTLPRGKSGSQSCDSLTRSPSFRLYEASCGFSSTRSKLARKGLSM